MSRATVFVSVGTDHHPFQRAVDWSDAIARRHGSDVHVVVQHGHSAVPSLAEGHDFLSYALLTTLMAEADVVVTHGGPGTIMDARASGHTPVCLARDPALGEHVDAHQQRFVAVIAETGAVIEVRTEEEFHRVVDAVLEERIAARAQMIPRQRDGAHDRPGPRIPQQRQGSGIPVLADELDGILSRGQRPGRLRTVADFLRAEQKPREQ